MNTIVNIGLSPDYEIRVRFRYHKALTNRIKQIFRFAAYRPLQKCWDIPPTPHNLRALPRFAEEVNARTTFSLRKAHYLWRGFRRARIYASQAVVGPALHIPGWKGPLLPHRQAGVVYMARTRRCLVTDEDKDDRTIQALAAVAYLRAFPTVIVTPPDRGQSWLDLLHQTLPERTPVHLRDTAGHILPRGDIYLVSDAVLPAWLPLLAKIRPKAVIADAADRFIHWQSERTRALNRLVKGVPYRFLLTPRPVHNYPGELLSPLAILGLLDPVVLVLKRGRQVTREEAWSYFLRLSHTRDEQVLAPLNQALRVWGYLRRSPEDLALLTGDRDRRFVPVKLHDFAAYQALTWTWVLEIPSTGKRVHNPHIFQRLAALRRELGRQKWPQARAFLERLRGTEQKIAVVAHHQEMAERVAEHFGWPLIIGDTKKPRREEALRKFQEDPAVQGLVLGLHTRTGAPLLAAQHMVFLEMDWAWVIIDRLEQAGSAGKECTFWYLVAPDTLDMDMLRALARKKRMLDVLTAKADEEPAPG